MENIDQLREEFELLQRKLATTKLDDESYDVTLKRIGEIQKILNADNELNEKKKDGRKRRIGGFFKFLGMGALYILGEGMVLHAEESRPIISKALNMPKDILKLNDKG